MIPAILGIKVFVSNYKAGTALKKAVSDNQV